MSVNDFTPPRWLRNPHVQSIYGALYPFKIHIETRAEELILPDGDFIDLIWAGDENKPVVIFLHGLEGSINSNYIRSTMEHLAMNGWQTLLMHYRGCSGRPNKFTKAYSAGYSEDLQFLITTITERYPDHSVGIIGFSLGGNVALRFRQQFQQERIKAVVAVSTPYDLGACTDYIPAFYERILLKSLKRKAMKKMRLGYDTPVTVKLLKSIHTIRAFDDFITAPIFGFKNAEDYYNNSSSRWSFADITQPTLLINAVDDPFIPPASLPAAAELPSCVSRCFTKYGGHIGFIEGGSIIRPRRWYHKVINNYLHQYLTSSQQSNCCLA